MAACTFAVGTADTGNTPNTSGAFVPATGDLLVAFVVGSATLTDPGPLTSSIGGFTFTNVSSRVFATNHSIYSFVSDALVSDTSSQTVAFAPADTANGSIIFVYRISGMTKAGATAVLQSFEDNNGLTTLPSANFANACLTGNPTLVAIANLSNPAGVTPHADWTEPVGGDLGYDLPTIGGQCMHRNSGFTGTAIDYGANSATAWGLVAIELDASGAAAITSTPKRLPLVGVA